MKRITIIWDASFRRESQDKTRDLAIVSLLVENLNDATQGEASIDVILFRHIAVSPVTFSVKDGNGLKAFLESVEYDGIRRFDALPLPSEAPDFIVLFSDGTHFLSLYTFLILFISKCLSSSSCSFLSLIPFDPLL